MILNSIWLWVTELAILYSLPIHGLFQRNPLSIIYSIWGAIRPAGLFSGVFPFLVEFMTFVTCKPP